MLQKTVVVALACCTTLLSGLARAAGLPAGLPKDAPKEIPKQLEPWVPWVLHGEEAARCPFLASGDDSAAGTNCLWPSRLSVEVGDRAGSFDQRWRVFSAKGDWVPLPGDVKSWPQDVRIDGVLAVISDQQGTPRVHLPGGEHRVTGAFAWSSQPESLQLPSQTGLLSLTLRGKPVEIPEWDETGKLWLEKRVVDKPEEDRLVVNVVRRLDDEIPAALTTQLQLAVSGKNREVVIGPALLPGFTATWLQSALPVRLEADGRLRVQLRPGDWTVDLGARSPGALTSITEPKVPAPWADETVWAFESEDELRQVTLEGVPTVDPQQTRLPGDWRNLPAYRMRAGDTLKLVQGHRGEAEPRPDAVHLQRQLWLDYDGRGYTVHDELTGELHKDWRLDASPRLDLGRVAVSGRDQLLTRNEPAGPVGVEIRQGTLSVDADARVEGDVDRLPAVGWRHDFQSVTEQLNLPPGWRLLHATGVDDAKTWLSSWALVDICILLVAVLAVAKLFGLGWGLAALLALGLTHHEGGAPQWLWLAAIGMAVVVRLVPAGRFRQGADFLRLCTGAALVVALALFSVRQLRQAAYPVLEDLSEDTLTELNDSSAVRDFLPRSAPAQMAVLKLPSSRSKNSRFKEESFDKSDRSVMLGKKTSAAHKSKGLSNFATEEDRNAAVAAAPMALGSRGALGGAGILGAGGLGAGLANVPMPAAPPPAPELSYTLETDPNAKLQTGPGLTSWSWRSVPLTFNGPVEAAQEIRLYLIPPWVERLLGLLRVVLCALLAFCLLGVRKLLSSTPARPSGRGAGPAIAAVGVVLFGVTLAGGVARAAEPSTKSVIDDVTQRLLERRFPDSDMLDQLKERLLKKPSCAPNCLSMQRMKLEASGHRLTVDLEVSSAADTAAPVPGSAKEWRPSQVLVDGKPAAALWRDGEGTLWVEVTPGLHRIALVGPLPPHDSVQLALPMKPHYTVAHGDGWTIDGVQDDGEVEDILQLSRVVKPRAADGQKQPDDDTALEPSELPGFAMVTRTLQLGVRWTVHTQVSRLTPQTSALVLAVPLLPGEAVTSADVRVAQGKVLVNVPAGQAESSWDSVLKPSATFELVAPRDAAWVEDWRLDASPIWRAEAEGIAAIHGEDEAGRRLLEWRPWPGEKVTLHTHRPAGVAGPTVTVDQSNLTVTPALRTTDSQLVLRLRSSRAGEQVLTLPAGAKLTSLVIDGVTKSLRQQDARVTVPLVAGSESIALGWTEKHGPAVVTTAPAVDLGMGSVNAWTDLRIANRWLLYAGGPGAALGPVFLIWAVLLLLLCGAFFLARTRLVPMGTLGWFAIAVGFTQVSLMAGAIVCGLLLALGWSARRAPVDDRMFNLRQTAIAAGALCAGFALVGVIQAALLGQPEMLLAGNGSAGDLLRWYLDRSAAVLPTPWVVSLPLWAYRTAMLTWVAGLAWAGLRLAPWAWTVFSKDGLWHGAGKLSTEPHA